MKQPDTREGTCAWCGKHGETLYFIVWCFDGRIFAEWVCTRCRRIAWKATVNENED